MEITRQETKYIVREDELCISIIKHADGTMNVFRKDKFNRGLEFVGSDPEKIIAITSLVCRAVRELSAKD